MVFKSALDKHLIVFDGAMGTMIQRHGLKPGQPPEIFNMLYPELIEGIHKEYIQAGADVITTNTLGANELKLKDTGYTVEQVVTRAVELARKAAGNKWVALDIGPIGQFMEPMGTLSFDRVYQMYARQVRAGAQAGADLILIETIGDLYEAKAAVLAAKENSSLPVVCTLTFERNGRTLMGTDPLTAVVVLESLGVDALGANCSLGPEELLPIVKQILAYASVPVLVQPNAGLPKIVNGQTVYPAKPDVFQRYTSIMIQQGVRLVGCCCGTTPDYIKAVRKTVDDLAPVYAPVDKLTAVSSGSRTVVLGDGIKIIGGRINARLNEDIAHAIKSSSFGDLVSEAIDQRSQGADILAVNVQLPDITEGKMHERETLPGVIREVQAVVNLPLEINSSCPDALEAGMRVYNGKPLVRWPVREPASLESLLPLVKKYGACMVVSAMDEDGIPVNAGERLKDIEDIVHYIQSYGISKEDMVVDCGSTRIETCPECMEAIKTVRLVKNELGLKTSLSVERITAGLSHRGKDSVVNTFLAMALAAGLDIPVLDSLPAYLVETVNAFRALTGQSG